MRDQRTVILTILAISLSAGDYTWVKVKDDYGWGHPAYVLNLVAFHDRSGHSKAT